MGENVNVYIICQAGLVLGWVAVHKYTALVFLGQLSLKTRMNI